MLHLIMKMKKILFIVISHKLKNMVNVKKLEVDKYNCLLCDKYIPKEHYFSKEHIENLKIILLLTLEIL